MSDDQPPSSSDPGSQPWHRRLFKGLRGEPRDREELKQMLRSIRRRRMLDSEEQAMLEGVLEVSDTQVRDVMIPRSQMVVVDRDSPPHELLPVITESGHSRFPAIGEDKDEVVGILLAKDLLQFFAEGADRKFDIRECLRPVVFIPESKRLNTLLSDFRSSHNHMAIVVDEYGGVSGLLTIEDVLEQIVGDIDDEHDTEEEVFIQREDDRRYTVRALTRIEDFNEYFGTAYSDEEVDTVGGLVMQELGRLPRRGETATLDGLVFRVTRADRRRIEALQVVIPEPLATEPRADDG